MMFTGLALQKLNQLEAAIASYDCTIHLDPNDAQAYWNKGFALLLGGDFERGLPLYEWRWKKGDIKKRRLNFTQPFWLGNESLEGKSILLHCEQGLGDTIQFCRYVSRLSEAGVNVLFAPQKPLRGLMKTLVSNVLIVDENDPSLEFDVHSTLASLPLAFKTNLTSIPSISPYLFADEDRISRWKEKLGTDAFKIGICWEGGTSKMDPGRSFPVGHFYGLSKLTNIQLIIF